MSVAYQALYRKYRPKTFSDVIGQEHITETLKNQLSDGKIVHAYLFTGTRGTGKTSCAKILARAVNCLNLNSGDPCLECSACLSVENGENTDIVEIDAASNNGVDNIRELRELINFTPSSSKYRVYIIDEVHMLSIGAFNALLKTLEEPPEHVIFILATTEVHKLPATILSRCQRFDFKRIESDKICERIKSIASREGLTITDDAALLISAAADGGMRDALSILDLCASSSKDIDEQTVEDVCSMAGNEYLLEMADYINQKNTESALVLVDKLHTASVDMLRLLSDLTSHYRDLMIVKTVKGKEKPVICSTSRLQSLENQAKNYDIKDIMYCLSVLQSSFSAMQTSNRRCELEMAIIKMCNPNLSSDISSLERRISALELNKKIFYGSTEPKEDINEISNNENNIAQTVDIKNIKLENETQSQISSSKDNIKDEANEDTPLNEWNDILSILKNECPLIAGVLVGSTAYIKGEYLLIDAPNSQFKSMINGAGSSYRDSIRKAAYSVLGKTYKLGPYTKINKVDNSDPLLDLAQKVKSFEIG